MSNASSTLDPEQLSTISDERASEMQTLAESSLRALATPFQFAGFWSSVLLPLVYVPVLAGFAGGQSTLGLLLVVHAVALFCGHGYRSK
ncbi:hypothetical protein [Halorussus amylolyticus]|uniref:hypothetical protein n=1 Tax=Halorussus amylolyticus TaxID=1126242 RepID=UPI00138F6C65|nr:hypothetical protein [Halorussus amylolyticus]